MSCKICVLHFDTKWCVNISLRCRANDYMFWKDWGCPAKTGKVLQNVRFCPARKVTYMYIDVGIRGGEGVVSLCIHRGGRGGRPPPPPTWALGGHPPPNFGLQYKGVPKSPLLSLFCNSIYWLKPHNNVYSRPPNLAVLPPPLIHSHCADVWLGRASWAYYI